MIFTFILKNLPKILKKSSKLQIDAKNELPMIRIWKMMYHIMVYC